MNFPDTVDEFMELYKIVDSEQVYTNGAELIPIFRMKQWFNHIQSEQGQWIRETDTRFGEMLNDRLICSKCGIAFPTLTMFRRSYCPNCGIHMKGIKE